MQNRLMLNSLFLLNFKVPDQMNLWSNLKAFTQTSSDRDLFILSTCQRKLVLGTSLTPLLSSSSLVTALTGKQAYSFFLEVITGLNGVLKGETEIMFQFRTQLQHYRNTYGLNPKLLRILEKLAQDSKVIRTQYLMNIPIKTHAYCSKWIFQKESLPYNSKILILGTGPLCIDLIHQLNKNYRLSVVGRNQLKLEQLKDKYGIEIFSPEGKDADVRFDCFINTIPQNLSIIQNYITACQFNIFINYSPIKIDFSKAQKTFHFDSLLQILEQNNCMSLQKINQAYKAIDLLSQKRENYFYTFKF